MYRSILLPIDGSELSMAAARHGIELAKVLGAEITALIVTTPWATQLAREIAVVVPGAVVPEADYDTRVDTAAAASLRHVTDAAQKAGLEARALHVRHRDPHVAILDAAHGHGCDLIVMASHGRRGLAQLLIGSQTLKVLTHSHIPVLVYRRIGAA